MVKDVHVLIIEDSPEDAELCLRMLRTIPYVRYVCSIAGDADEGLAQLEQTDFDCVIVDYSLPGTDGLTLLATIRDRFPFLPLVMLTGQARDDIAAAVLDAGANNYVEKSHSNRGHLHEVIVSAREVCEEARRSGSRPLLPLLIIDDSEDDRERYIRLLKGSSYRQTRIVEAGDGLTGLQQLRREAFEAILLDYQLPGMDGLEVLAQIRKHSSGVPVIFMTGHGNVSVAVTALRSGASDYLIKSSLDGETLAKAIAESVMKSAIATKDQEILAKTEALRRANERITLATDSGGIGIWEYDIATREIAWDAWMFRLYGQPPRTAPGTYETWRDSVHPDDRAGFEQAFRDAAGGTAPYDIEFRVTWPDATIHSLRGCAQLTRDSADAPPRFIGVNWDVTESRQLAASLALQAQRLAEARDVAQRANQAKSRFLAGMSHELRTPLNAILGYARLLQMEGGLNQTQTARVDSMLGAGTHLLEMIHCVLDLSEIETERVALQSEPVDLRTLAAACLDVVRHTAEAKRLTLNLTIERDMPAKVMADPVRLRQILLNLLGNATKFTLRGGVELRLRTAAGGESLRFDVADSGPGILLDQRHRLFQDFARLEPETGRPFEGAGLGLSLSARLASLMGGRLDYVDNPAGGSIFLLEVPLVPCETPRQDANADWTGAETELDPTAGQTLHVLVVDDSDINRDIAASFIRLAGHQVTCASDGTEAVAAVANMPFDVVMMDVQMPGMDGLEATRRIRSLNNHHAQVPIFALTAQAFTEQIEACRRAGMTGHLAKPFNWTDLFAVIAEVARHGTTEFYSDDPTGERRARSSLPVIAPEVFATNTRLLNPETVIDHLENLVAISRIVLAALRAYPVTAEFSHDLLQSAHKLSGTLGGFGFARAAEAGRRFERAARTGSPDMPVIADHFAAALEISLHVIDERKRGAAAAGTLH